MSYRKYKIIDLLIWLVILLALEAVVTFAATRWFKEEPYSISLILPIVLLVMMRWGYYAFIHSTLSAVAVVFYLTGVSAWEPYAIYLLGSLGLMASLGFLLPMGKERVASKWYFSVLFVLIAYLSMELFRGFGAMLFKGYGIDVIPQYLLTDALNLAFGLIVILICRRVPGLFCDQKAYLFALERERNAQEEAAKNVIPDMPSEEEEGPEL